MRHLHAACDPFQFDYSWNEDDAAWRAVRIRQAFVTSIKEALDAPGCQPPSIGELALVKVATAALARSAADYARDVSEDRKSDFADLSC